MQKAAAVPAAGAPAVVVVVAVAAAEEVGVRVYVLASSRRVAARPSRNGAPKEGFPATIELRRF